MTQAGAREIYTFAYLPENEQKLILDEAPFERFNENTITNRRAYEKELATVRELGYALDRAEQIRGAHRIGAPVFDQYGYPIAAIWATGPSDRLPADASTSLGRSSGATPT